MEKEDFLLSQIDEFREKAKQLQSLLATKETKVQELQEIVEEREGKAKELSDMLDEKKDAADKVVEGVRGQIDGMVGQVDSKMRDLIGQVDAKMKELNETFAERLAENALNSTEQHEEVKKQISLLKLRKLRRELHEAGDVEAFLSDMLIRFKTRLLAVPPKLAMEVAGEGDLNIIIQTIKKALEEVLSELAEYNPDEIDGLQSANELDEEEGGDDEEDDMD